MLKKVIFFVLLPVLILFFFVIIMVGGLMAVMGGEMESKSDISSSFELSETVLSYQNTVEEILSDEGLDEDYTAFILAMIEVLTKGEGSDVMRASRFSETPITTPKHSMEYGIREFKELLEITGLPKDLDDEEPDTAKMQFLLQIYVFGRDFVDYVGSENYTASLAESYATENEIEGNDKYFAEDVYFIKNTAIKDTGGDGSPMAEGFNPIWPTPGYNRSWVTWEFIYGTHWGFDIGAPNGAAIVAVQSGKVISAEYHSSWGYNVYVLHNDRFSTRYAHCSSMIVSAGEFVERGQIIGYVGDTGYSFGNHLHFEVYRDGTRVDPDIYLIHADDNA